MIHRSLIEDSQSTSNKTRARNSIKILIDDSLLPQAVTNVDREVKHQEGLEHYEASTENHKPLALNCRSGKLNGFGESKGNVVGDLPRPEVTCDQDATDLKTTTGRKRRIALNGDDMSCKAPKCE